jgi:hypothetical protein
MPCKLVWMDENVNVNRIFMQLWLQVGAMYFFAIGILRDLFKVTKTNIVTCDIMTKN